MSDETGKQFAGTVRRRRRAKDDTAPERRPRKFTVLLDPDVVDEMVLFQLKVQRGFEGTVDRSEIVRALIEMALEDETQTPDIIAKIKAARRRDGVSA